MTLSIRLATSHDAERLTQIGKETFSDTFEADNTPENMAAYLASAFGREIQAKELDDPNSVYLIAEMEGETVGYARLVDGHVPPEVTGNHPVELARIYARKAWLGHGVGAALMQASLEQARTMGADTLWLGVWERNPRAIAFYQKWGFVKTGTQTFRLGDDPQTDWVMQRKVV